MVVVWCRELNYRIHKEEHVWGRLILAMLGLEYLGAVSKDVCTVNSWHESLRRGREVRVGARDCGVTIDEVMVRCRKWVSSPEGVCR